MKQVLNTKFKKFLYDSSSWVIVFTLIFSAISFVLIPHAKATSSFGGQLKEYLHKENSDANEQYNSMGITPPEPAADTSTGQSINFVQSKSAASNTVNFTNSPIQNDLEVAFVYTAGSTTVPTMTSAGWTAGATTCTGGTGGNRHAGNIFWKIAASGESATVTSSGGTLIAVSEYSGVDVTTPNLSQSGQSNASGTNTTPSVTPTASKVALAVSGLGVLTANGSYSAEAISGTNGVTLADREQPKNASATADLFDKTISSTSGAYQGSATPSAGAQGCGMIAIFQAAVGSNQVVNASPATNFCEAGSLTRDNFNQVTVAADTLGERCVTTFISQPIMGLAGPTTICASNNGTTCSGADPASITGQFWFSKTSTTPTVAMNIYIYRWSGTGTSVSSSDRIATLTCANQANTTVDSCTPTAVAPANNVTLNLNDRLVAIMSLTVSGTAASGATASSYFDSTGRTGTYIKMGYTDYGYNSSDKPTLSGPLDDDFTTDAATTACTTGGVAYNTKWTCLQGSASNTAGNFNAGGTTTPNGDSSGWLWLQDQTTSTLATPCDFDHNSSGSCATPSNTFLYQTLPGDYGNGNITTVINSSVLYDLGSTPSNSGSPYSHSGLVLWTSNSDYIIVQVYSDAAINNSATNTVHVALNNDGTISGTQNLNSATTSNGFSNIWVRFANTGGSYQAQYSTDGSIFTNVGSAVTHDAFMRVGLDAYAAVGNPIMSYAGAFEWFSSTLASATYNQDAYRWNTNADSATPGTADAASNTAYTTLAAGEKVRLRLDLAITGQSNAGNTPPAFKLQFVDRGTGTCASPAGGTPSSYTDVTTSTLIAYFNNPTPSDGANISTSAGNDPAGSGTNVAETYEELNNFSATQNNLNNGNDGLWDFSLVDNGAAAGSTYCFRVVTAGGSSLTTYTNYPTLTIFGASATPTTDQLLRGGEWFNSSGVKQSFFWTK